MENSPLESAVLVPFLQQQPSLPIAIPRRRVSPQPISTMPRFRVVQSARGARRNQRRTPRCSTPRPIEKVRLSNFSDSSVLPLELVPPNPLFKFDNSDLMSFIRSISVLIILNFTTLKLNFVDLHPIFKEPLNSDELYHSSVCERTHHAFYRVYFNSQSVLTHVKCHVAPVVWLDSSKTSYRQITLTDLYGQPSCSYPT